MEEKCRKYLLSCGIDLDDLSHPISLERDSIIKFNNPDLAKIIEHLIMMLTIDIDSIKKHNLDDFNHYLTKLKKKDISFWGERFEIFFYNRLISKLNTTIKDIKRGVEGKDADFIVEYNGHYIAIETTSLNFSKTSPKENPITKLKNKIFEKDRKPYSNLRCCLIIDITNLIFYRKIYKNFSISIAELFASLESKFGAILLLESVHIIEGENLIYKSQVYDWLNPNIDIGLKEFLSQTLVSNGEDIDSKVIYLKH